MVTEKEANPGVWTLVESQSVYRLYHNNLHGSALRYCITMLDESPGSGDTFFFSKTTALRTMDEKTAALFKNDEKNASTKVHSGLTMRQKAAILRRIKKRTK